MLIVPCVFTISACTIIKMKRHHRGQQLGKNTFEIFILSQCIMIYSDIKIVF